MNGHSYTVALVTLLLAILGLAFWLGTQAQEIIALRTEVALLSPVEADHRVTVLEQKVEDLEKTCQRKP